MKLNVVRFVYEAPALEIIPETEYEAAVLSRYWEKAELTIGRASPSQASADGHSYGIRFKGGKQPKSTQSEGDKIMPLPEPPTTQGEV